MNLYLVETNKTFAQHLSTACMMDDPDMEYDCTAISDMNNDMQLVQPDGDGILVSNIASLSSIPEEIVDRMAADGRVYVYATLITDTEKSDGSGYKSYGHVQGPKQLFRAIKNGRYTIADGPAKAPAQAADAAAAHMEPQDAAQPATPPQGAEYGTPARQAGQWQPQAAQVQQAQPWQPQAAQAPQTQPWQPQAAQAQQAPPWQPQTAQTVQAQQTTPWQPQAAPAQQVPQAQQPVPWQPQAAQPWQPAAAPQAQEPAPQAGAWTAPPWAAQPAQTAKPNQPENAARQEQAAWAPDGGPWQPSPAQPRQGFGTAGASDIREALLKSHAEEQRAAAEAERRAFEAATSREQPPAKVVAVTSAKGGVGKTTISTSLAVMLARMEHGTRHGMLSVCLVDYNIDFGNVRGTLNLEQSGMNMSHMAADVRERVAKSQTLEYTKDEIRAFLRVHEPSGLYVLCAPETNVDSMFLEYPVTMPDGSKRDVPTLSIILDNIRRNGGFDVVVLDTNNSTRDAVLVPIKTADTVFVIAQQDVNAAMSVADFYATYAQLRDVDMTKFKLVINRVLPARKAGNVSPDEVTNFLYKNAQQAGAPGMECVATIDMSNDVLSMINMGRSMVLERPNSQFTRAIGDMARIVHDGGPVLQERKRGFLSRLRRKGG